MNGFIRLILMLAIVWGSNPCSSTQQTALNPTARQSTPTKVIGKSHACQPTLDDGVSPSYKPETPERTVVGKGHIVTGVVLSSADCQPIAHAKLEFWPEVGDIGHPDSERATFYTDQEGRYRYECDMPDHIHMRISAPNYHTIGVNSYHPNGQAEGTFDIVLELE